MNFDFDFDFVNIAVESLDMPAIQAFAGQKTLNIQQMNLLIHRLSETVIRSLIDRNEYGEHMSLGACVDEVKVYYAALLRVPRNMRRPPNSGGPRNMGEGPQNTEFIDYNALDFSPWHVFKLFTIIKRELINSAEDEGEFPNRGRALLFGATVVLLALPHRGLTAHENAFMEVRGGQTPLMYAAYFQMHSHILSALFARGGFSASEWTSGAVAHLLYRGKIQPAVVEGLLQYNHLDTQNMMRLADEEGNTLLHYYCKWSEFFSSIHNDLSLLIQTLGADPHRVNKAGLTPAAILRQRLENISDHDISAINKERMAEAIARLA